MKKFFLAIVYIMSNLFFASVSSATDPTSSCASHISTYLTLCNTVWGGSPPIGYYTFGPTAYTSDSSGGYLQVGWRGGCRYAFGDLSVTACTTLTPTGYGPPSGGGGCEKTKDGSVIRVDELSVGEEVPLVGTPFNLVYTSARVIGYQEAYKIHNETGTPESGQTDTKFDFYYESSRHDTQTISSTLGTSYDFYWDGKNASNVLLEGRTKVTVKSTLMFSSTPSDLSPPIDKFVGTWLTKFVGLGGWNINIHHFYDQIGKRIYMGDGSVRDVEPGTFFGTFAYDFAILSEDGSEIYYFNSSGKHTSTNNALTNAAIYTFTRDGSGRLATIVDAYSNTTTVLRDGSGNLTGIESPYSQVTDLTLDGNGYLDTIENPAGEIYTMTYYTGGLLNTFELPRGQVSTMTYDADGNLTQDSSSAGNYIDLVLTTALQVKTINMSTAEGYQSSSVVTYSGTNYTRLETESSGLTRNFSYAPASTIQNNINSGHKTTTTNYTTDPRFLSALYIPSSYTDSTSGMSYMSHSYNQTVTNTALFPTAFNYDSILYQSYINSNLWASNYDKSTGETITTSPEGRITAQTHDTYGKLTSSTHASYLPVDYSYDMRGRLEEIDQGARTTTMTYNSGGFVSSITNPLSEATSYTYDSAGRVLTITLPDTRVITYTYDDNGNVTSVTPPGTNVHTFTLNNFDLNSSYIPPALGMLNVVTYYAYNDDKQLTLVTRPDTSTLTYAYNSTTGLLTSITTGSGSNSYTLNTKGQVTGTTSIDGITLTQYFYGYDLGYSYSDLASPNTNTGGVNFSYNSDHNVSNITVNAASSSTDSASFSYDTDGLLEAAGAQTLNLSSTTGFVDGTNLDNIDETMTYDSSYGELASFSSVYTPGPTTLFSESMTRDYLGRIATRTESVNSVTNTFSFTYDTAGRLTDVVKNSVILSDATYDSNSNRTSGNVLGTAFTATYDDHDRIITYNSNTYTFNVNGEIATKVNGMNTTTYAFDEFGNLKSVTLPSTTVISYLVDGLNRRVGRKIGSSLDVFWVYQDQTTIAAELNSSGVISKRFVYSTKKNVPDYMIFGGNTYKIISDYLGSVRIVANANTGVVSQRLEYDEYGKVITDTNPGFQPFGFAGGLYDIDTKLYHFGARDYDPETGRWLSKDPILFNGGDTNLYGYVMQDPVNWIDPDGLNPIIVIPAVIYFGGYLGDVIRDWQVCNALGASKCRENRSIDRAKREMDDSMPTNPKPPTPSGPSNYQPPSNPWDKYFPPKNHCVNDYIYVKFFSVA